ncbi:Signal recognition particle GTPase [Pseudomonas syringae pv. actinidiae]|uniref:Signal recognition particle GTPase n=1 Tax=Pseudomonas syringae pv. actinidiae TaxID=103796 RepID=A0A2V0QIG7_PSESF|nr:Signal recognition particle GTPase [Pseudomonas syringae pv. actinidiae]
MHAIIGTLRLFAENVNTIVLKRAAFDQLLDAMMTDHAITDDDQGFYISAGEDCGVHSESRPRPIRFFEAKKKAPGTFRSQAPLPVLLLEYLSAIERRCRMHLSSPLASTRLAIDIDQPERARPHSWWGYVH